MFFFPLFDDNPSGTRPYVCYGIIALCIFFFFWQSSLPPDLLNQAVNDFGVVPIELLGDQENSIPPTLTIFTSMFMHGGWFHLIGNMVFLWIFGDNVEDAMGKTKFLIFYLLCGLLAALLQSIIDPTSNIPMIGASGAIAGVLGAYLLLYPRANINVLMWIVIIVSIIKVPAFIVLGFWIVSQFFSGAMADTSSGGVAYFAHIGGFIAGMSLIAFFKHPSVKMFQEGHSYEFETQEFREFMDYGIPKDKTKGFMEDFIDKANNRKDK